MKKLPHDRSTFFSTHRYWSAVEDFFKRELENDGEDITSLALFEESFVSSAQIIAKQEGIFCGKEEASFLIQTFFPTLILSWNIAEGEYFIPTSRICSLSGSVRDILKVERILLNTFSRMSGVATQTCLYSESAKTHIAATRKTQWSYLDKKAVWKGGGLTHRIGLFDAILIKENHCIALGNGRKNILLAFEKALEKSIAQPLSFVEIETENPDEFLKSYEYASNPKWKHIQKIIMFDNFSKEDIRFCLERIPAQNIRHEKNIFLEISGGITLSNIAEYDDFGSDVISIGALTHSVLPIDFSLRMEECK